MVRGISNSLNLSLSASSLLNIPAAQDWSKALKDPISLSNARFWLTLKNLLLERALYLDLAIQRRKGTGEPAEGMREGENWPCSLLSADRHIGWARQDNAGELADWLSYHPGPESELWVDSPKIYLIMNCWDVRTKGPVVEISAWSCKISLAQGDKRIRERNRSEDPVWMVQTFPREDVWTEMVYCGTHCDKLQFPQRHVFYAWLVLFYSCLCFVCWFCFFNSLVGRLQGQKADTKGQEMKGGWEDKGDTRINKREY